MKIDKSVLKLLPNVPKKPGVYLFKDKEGNVLYVGKAIDLRKRVKSYFQQLNKHSIRIQKLVSQIRDIDFTVVSGEVEAIILETNMIKELKPKYNIMMRDDKNFVYIKISRNEDFPQISIVRKVENDKALYFGPKTAAGKTRKTLTVLKKIFPYRHCNLFLEYDKSGKVNVTKKTTKYPCLDYHIKRCIGPCVSNCTKEEYAEIIEQIIRFLNGKTDEIIKALTKEMEQAAVNKNFEKAAKIRDKLQAVQTISEKQIVSAPNRKDIDTINYVSELGRIYFTLFMIRDGKVINQENFVFKTGDEKEKVDDESEILEAFLNQYYEKATDFPKEILLPSKVNGEKALNKWLNDLKGKKVAILYPQKGEKYKILELAKKNAETFANQSKVRWQQDEDKRKKALDELQKKLNLKKPPRRIECYDISHISGTNQVASMVVFENGSPSNKKYRRFKIRSVEEGKPDDFAAMLEVLKRRILYLVKSKSSIKIRKAAKKDNDAIAKLIGKKKFDIKKYEKGSDDKGKIVGTLMYEKLEEVDHFHDIQFAKIKDEVKKDFIIALIDKAKKSRVYASIDKSLVKLFEEIGFQHLKSAPKHFKQKKGKECLMFNKSKYTEEKGFSVRPDLIVIDGGKGQLTQGINVERKYGVDIPLVALAKKEEQVFVPGKKEHIGMAKDSEGLYLLQQVRDEAHRFALAYHRKLRSKSMFNN